MSDKPVGLAMAVVALVGACAVCALGPTVFVSVLATASGWLAGLNPLAAIALGLVVALVAHGLWRARSHARPPRPGQAVGEQ